MRTRLYHDTVPQGMIFTDQKAHDEAISEGWQEAPWLVKQEDNNNVLIASHVPNSAKLCACGCGSVIEKGKYLNPEHYHEAMRAKRNGNLKNDQPPD